MAYTHGLILIIISVIEIILGLVIILKDTKNVIKRWFSIFIFSVSLWVGSLGLDLLVESKKAVEIIGYFPWIGGLLIVCSLLFFSWVWPFKIKSLKIYHWLLFTVPILIFTILIVTSIAPVVKPTQLDEWRSNTKDVSYPLYNLFISVYLIWAVVNFIKKYKISDGIHRWQLKFFSIGIGITSIIVLVTNIILPWFEITNWGLYESALGPEASIIWLIFSTYILFKKDFRGK